MRYRGWEVFAAAARGELEGLTPTPESTLIDAHSEVGMDVDDIASLLFPYLAEDDLARTWTMHHVIRNRLARATHSIAAAVTTMPLPLPTARTLPLSVRF